MPNIGDRPILSGFTPFRAPDDAWGPADLEAMEQLAQVVGAKYPSVSWDVAQADGVEFGIVSQPPSAPGGPVLITVEYRSASAPHGGTSDASGWVVADDGEPVFPEPASRPAPAIYRAATEFALQILTGN